MGLSKELQIGKAGEHLVCFDLIIQGYNAFLADQGLPFDILIERRGKLLKVQVRSTSQKTHGYQKTFIVLEPEREKGLLHEFAKQKLIIMLLWP